MPDQPNTDEGADPSGDIRQQNPGGTTTADLVDADDPEKAQKLADPDGEHDLDAEKE
jgi:hypothetical protein